MSPDGNSKRSHARSLSLVLTACVLVLVYCTSYLDAVAHYVLVQHERCLEHGTWEHVEHDEHAGNEPREGAFETGLATVEGGSGEQRARSGSSPAAHNHEHCTHWGAGQRQAADRDTSEVSFHARLVSASSELVDLPPGALLLSAAIYAFAPKTSPPV